MSLNAARKSPTGNLLTPKVRIVYPALFRPTLPPNEKDESKKRYNVTLLVPKDADISLLEKEVDMLIEAEVPANKRSKVKRPFRATEDVDSLSEFADEFPVFIRCAAEFAPDVVHPNGQRTFKEEEEADEVYGGRWARASLRPFFWDHKTGGLGVSLGLRNIQMLDHAEPIAGGRVRGTDEFEAADESELEEFA